jgi:colanic acid/amylovoran biosynthesis glycosyltransferase
LPGFGYLYSGMVRSTPSAFTPVSVVVPAHNEEAVIGRCLSSLLTGAQDGEFEIVVVCNGCHDGTAEVARRAAPQATVLELPVASKIAALNAGDEHAKRFPRFYVDADLELSAAAIRQVAAALTQNGVLCAAPKPSFDLEDCPWAIRAFYNIWLGTPYHAQERVGGVYALSEEGRSRFDVFPELTADDQFVQQLFERSERRAVQEARFIVRPPRNLRGLLKTRTRTYRGNRELALSGLARAAPPPSGAKSALRRARQPREFPAVALYVTVNLLAKGLARRSFHSRWERDDSARSAGATVPGSARQGSAPLAVCYVTSHYPALSHTFVMREIMGVRAAGLSVATVSVHQADTRVLLAQADRDEAARTWNIFPVDSRVWARAHARAALKHPRAYVRTLAHALSSAPPGLRGRLWQLFYFGEAIALWDHADEVGARHLHAHLANVAADISWLASTFGKRAQPGRGWRWSFTMHGATEFYSIEKFNLARKVAYADGVVCISDYTKSQLMYVSAPQHWAKLHVVHCGVDFARYPYVAPTPKPGLSVLCVCRLAPEKGLEVLMRAIAVVAKEGIDVRLVLVGSGPLEATLRCKATDLGLEARVSFEGAVGQDDMARYYAEADVFCLPSFAEGVPVVLMEAMATGRPVIATWIAGVPELVEDGISGLLVAPGNFEELADALLRLSVSPEERESLGLAGRHKVEKAFDSGHCAAELARVFTDMALSRGAQA